MTKKFEKRVQKMMGRAAAALLCALTFTAVLPAAPVYARPKRNTSAQADKERMQDAAGMVQAAFDQKDMDALASLCAYPLTYSDQSGSSRQIRSRKELRALGKEAVFADSLRDAVLSTNSAKAEAVNGELKLGESAGLAMKKVKKRWKVVRIWQAPGTGAVPQAAASQRAASGLTDAAERYQRTFYYRDLETLSKQCTYPLKLYLTDGNILDISSPSKLMELGEGRVFTDAMVEEVNQVNAADLKDMDGRAQVGSLSGFWMVKKNGEWKIDLIIQ